MSRKMSKKNRVEYWQSYADIMSVLVLVLILILIIIFALFFELDEIGDNERGEANIKIEGTENTTHDGTGSNVSKFGEEQKPEEETSGGGGGGGGGKNNNTGIGKYDTPPIEYTGIGTDKAAVYIVVIDGETKQVIREAGIQFRLHEAEGSIKTLNVYYPEKTTYESFTTTKAGTFYFPEKIPLGSYFLHQLTESKGYDLGKDLHFELKKALEWENPYVINFPIYPSKNIMKLHITDTNKGEGILGGTYQIVAAEDIVTLDGTLRANAGEVVDEITCDENGYAQSKELYLGNYTIVQKNIPHAYASLEDIPKVVLEKRKDEKDFQAVDLACEKTKVNVAVWDELNDTNGLDEVIYVLSNSNNDQTLELATNRLGEFEITNLEKNTTYYLTEVKGKENYLLDEEVYEFTVDDKGRIENNTAYKLDLYNRKIRVKVKVSNAIFNLNFIKPQMYLKNENGDIVYEWTGNHLGTEIEGLAPGKYLLGSDGNESIFRYGRSKWITIQNKADIQKVSFKIWSIWSIVACLAIVSVIGILIIVYIRKHKNKKRKE